MSTGLSRDITVLDMEVLRLRLFEEEKEKKKKEKKKGNKKRQTGEDWIIIARVNSSLDLAPLIYKSHIVQFSRKQTAR